MYKSKVHEEQVRALIQAQREEREVLMYAGPIPQCGVVYEGATYPNKAGAPCVRELGHPVTRGRWPGERHMDESKDLYWYTAEEKKLLFSIER